MQTSTHIRPALHYSQIGPGGWHCLCCAPQSGKKYAAKAKAQLRRQAKKRERAAFIAEQVRLELATAESLIIEQRIAEDEYQDKCNAIQDEAEQKERESSVREQNWLERLIGHSYWDRQPAKQWPFWEDRLPEGYKPEEAWVYAQVEEGYCNNDSYGADYGYVREFKAAVAIDRTNQQWIVWTWSGQQEAYETDNPAAAFLVLPMAEHSLEEMQRLAAIFERTGFN